MLKNVPKDPIKICGVAPGRGIQGSILKLCIEVVKQLGDLKCMELKQFKGHRAGLRGQGLNLNVITRE